MFVFRKTNASTPVLAFTVAVHPCWNGLQLCLYTVRFYEQGSVKFERFEQASLVASA